MRGRNASDEFIEETKGKKVKCARIFKDRYDIGDTREEFILKVGHSDLDLKDFVSSINFEYDDGYGAQELFGTIWYEDGTWSEREEYDGSEWWEYKSCPEIPEVLK